MSIQLVRWLGATEGNSRTSSRRYSWKPLLEQCESRCMPAVITVTGTGDGVAADGLVTLREAVSSINGQANVNADVVAVGNYGRMTRSSFKSPAAA